MFCFGVLIERGSMAMSKIDDFVFGKKCPKCDKGRLNIYCFGGFWKCDTCAYADKEGL